MAKSLDDFNKRGVLSNLLAIEEHLVGNNEIAINQWCAKKHYLLGRYHHGFELQQINETKDPTLAKKVGGFNSKWDNLMEKNPTASDIRDLRNEFREIIKDKTLDCKNKVCKLDRLKPKEDVEEEEEETTLEVSDDKKEKSKALIVISILAGAGLIAYMGYKFA